MIYDSIDNLGQYFTTDTCKQVLEFIETLTPESSNGRFPIVGDDLVINVDSYRTKELSDCVLETHKKYVDIQLLISGEEYMDIYPAKELTIKSEYDVDRDVVFYNVPDTVSARIKLVPGYFITLFSQDAHMPQLKVSENCDVKKVVVKVIPSLLK